MPSAVVLTQELVRFKTINPPGAERACAQHLATMLEGAGFKFDNPNVKSTCGCGSSFNV